MDQNFGSPPPSPPRREPTLEALLAEIASGSDAAAWELIDRYSKNILRVVRRQLPAELREKLDPNDIVQSVWKSLLRKGPSSEVATAEQFLAYLAGMARHKVLETHRRFTRCQATNIRREVKISADPRPDHENGGGGEELSDPRAQTPASIVAARERWGLALDHAGARGRQVVELKLQGLSLEEIAERLSISKRTVQRILSELLASLTA